MKLASWSVASETLASARHLVPLKALITERVWKASPHQRCSLLPHPLYCSGFHQHLFTLGSLSTRRRVSIFGREPGLRLGKQVSLNSISLLGGSMS